VINDEYKRLQRAVALLSWIQDSFEEEEDSAFLDYAGVVRAARDIVDATHCRLCAANVANAMAERDQTLRDLLKAHSK
jgi:alkylhydroperoxidase family enzyme